MSPTRKRSGCPLCGRASAQAFTPFCSAPCKDRDLLRWLDERYVIPGRPALPPDDENDPDRP